MFRSDLRSMLLEAIEEGISSLGASPKYAIFFHLENSFKVRKEKIPANLTAFTEALEKIFGPGAFYLENLIVKRLYEKMGLEYEEIENWSFLEYVDNAKEFLMIKKRGSKWGTNRTITTEINSNMLQKERVSK